MTGRQRKRGLYAAIALAAGLALRLWFVAHAARVDGDTLLYGSIARNWMQHGVYGFALSANGPVPTLIRLPGYPIFLMACFRVFGIEHYSAVMYVQCAIDLLTCLLIAALAGRLFDERAAMAALWLSALCPFMATYPAAPLTEVLTLFTIALTFYSLERWSSAGCGFNKWLWVLAIAMAYSVLLRPEQGLLAATVIPAMLWMVWRLGGWPHSRWKRMSPIAVAAICVVL
ncbi:MAG: glycosyltransferase family 39 protein, partial [Edaphobacter sp.]